MKTRICLLFLLAFVSFNYAFSQNYLKSATSATRLERTMNLNDENRNPLWKWYENTNYTFVTYSGTYTNVKLPFFASEGPCAEYFNYSTNKDMYPVDGWVLVLRDFGTVELPYFVLYNKYRGILRFFYWSTLETGYSHAVGKLSFQNNSNTLGFFTLTNKDVTLGNYNAKGATSVVSINKIMQHQWCWFDFDLSGYDPSVITKTDPTLILEITGVTETSLVVKGDISFSYDNISVAKNGSSGGFNNVINGAISNYTDIAKRFRNINDAQAEYKKWANLTENSTKWYAQIINVAANGASGDFIKSLASIASIVNYAIGGGSSSAASQAPLLKRGDIELKGTLTTNEPRFIKTIRVPGSIHADPTNDAISNILPLYDVPLGLYNLAVQPVIELNDYVQDFVDQNGTGSYYLNSNGNLQPLNYVYNTNVFSGCSIKLSEVSDISNISNYVDKLQFYNTIFCNEYTEYYENDRLIRKDQVCGHYFQKLGMLTTLTPKETNVIPVDLLKSYVPDLELIQGLKSASILKGIEVFPNPVTQVLNIRERNNESINEIQIYNIAGQLVRSLHPNLSSASINCEDLHSGLYLLKIRTDHDLFEEKVQILK